MIIVRWIDSNNDLYASKTSMLQLLFCGIDTDRRTMDSNTKHDGLSGENAKEGASSDPELLGKLKQSL